MNKLIDNLVKETEKIYKELVKLRREFHSKPELSGKEFETSKKILNILNEIKLDDVKIIAKTGVVGLLLSKKKAKKTIALRADIDALPIEEKNDVPYKSINKGVMHACGHDVHLTCLLGTAIILSKFKEVLNCNVKFLFQPSEEEFPGGAIQMINEGVLDNPKVDIVLGQHVLPTLECGKVGFKKELFMASTDEIYITVKGKGGHGATPELNIDPVVIAAEIILSLQQIVSRNASPVIPTVLSFGKVIANGKTNIIPDRVEIAGTLRTFDEKWREDALNKIKKISQNISKAHGANCIVKIVKGYPYLYNDPTLTENVKKFAEIILGKENVVDIDLRMTSEDFAYFSHKKPSCFYRLGVKSKNWKEIKNLHTATFDVDEMSLYYGTLLFSWLILNGNQL